MLTPKQGEPGHVIAGFDISWLVAGETCMVMITGGVMDDGHSLLWLGLALAQLPILMRSATPDISGSPKTMRNIGIV